MPISLSGSLLITGSITTTGGITISGSILSASYSATSSFSNDFTVLGNLTVYGTQSVQYITSSQLNVSDNVITVNVASPGVRFGGLSVFDSGSLSSEATASLFWDSQNNHWIYQRESGSSYTGGMLISGPRNAAGLGNELGTTNCMLLVGQGGDHLTSSMIYHDSNRTCFYTNATLACSNTFGSNLNSIQTFTGSVVMTGSLVVNTTGPELQVNNNGVTIGNLQADNHSITGSLRITGSNVIFNVGCVGIGTTPIQQLTIVGGTTTSPGSFTGNYAFGLISGSSQAFAIGNDSSFAYIQSFSSRPLYLNSQGNNVILAGAGANVGIGTITPTGTYGKLSVAGGISILDDNNAKLEIGRYSSGAPNSYIKIGTNSNSLRITNAADSIDLLTISNCGHVGMCVVPSPWASGATALQVGTTGTLWNRASDGLLILGSNSYFNGSADIQITTGASNRIYFVNGNTVFDRAASTAAGSNTPWQTSMTITSAGNVCIGSSAVGGEILRINGCSCSDNYISVYSGTIQMFLDADKTNNAGIVGTQSSHPLILRTNGTNKLSISTAGVLDFPGSNSTATSASDTMSFGLSGASYAWIQTWGGRPLRINELGNNVNAFGTNGYGLVNTTASDVRIKKNIVSIENALAKVNCLRGVYYEFDENNSMCMKVPSGKRRVGLIAQEVGCVLPEALLDSQDDSTPISLDYSGMIGLLTKAIQEQQCTINLLKTCIGIA